MAAGTPEMTTVDKSYTIKANTYMTAGINVTSCDSRKT
jgi:hypothetical protein